MKKRVLLISILAVMLIAAFAFVVSAEDNIIKHTTLPTLEEIHANPSAYVSHLDAFDSSTYKEQDANSVIVLSDLQATPTYYAFPAYYLFNSSSYYPGVTDLNTALAALNDSTIFSKYTATAQRGGNVHLVRVEVPTYVTSLSGFNKFEGSTSLVEVYFPTKTVVDAETGEEKITTYVTSVTDANTFTNCTKLEVVHNIKYLPKGIINGGAFSNCNALKSFEFPEGITSIPNGLLSGCHALESIEIPDGVTSIGESAFSKCKAIKEIILPNSVASIGKNAFTGMTALEKISYGADCTKLTGSDNNMEIITSGHTNLKYVYMPADFASEVSDTSKSYNSMFGFTKKIIIFFTGTLEDYNRIKDFASQYSNNTGFTGIALDEYDPSVTYDDTYYDSKTKATLVYNYNLCEAFYEGEHTESETLYKTWLDKEGNQGQPFLSYLKVHTECGRECGKENVKASLAPLFVDRGFAYGPSSMLQGVAVDRELLDEYGNYFTGIKYGLVAAAKSAQASASIIDANGVGANGYVAAVDYTERDYDLFEMNLFGISEDYQATEFYFGAYVIADGQVYYIHNGTTNNEAQAITYDDVVVIVDALIPENKEDGDNA